MGYDKYVASLKDSFDIETIRLQQKAFDDIVNAQLDAQAARLRPGAIIPTDAPKTVQASGRIMNYKTSNTSLVNYDKILGIWKGKSKNSEGKYITTLYTDVGKSWDYTYETEEGRDKEFNEIKEFVDKNMAYQHSFTSALTPSMFDPTGFYDGLKNVAGQQSAQFLQNQQNSQIKKEDKSMFKDMQDYIKQHRDMLYTFVIVLLIDHFVFEGAFQERLKGIVDSFLKKHETPKVV